MIRSARTSWDLLYRGQAVSCACCVHALLYEFPDISFVTDLASEYLFDHDLLAVPAAKLGAHPYDARLSGSESIPGSTVGSPPDGYSFFRMGR